MTTQEPTSPVPKQAIKQQLHLLAQRQGCPIDIMVARIYEVAYALRHHPHLGEEWWNRIATLLEDAEEAITTCTLLELVQILNEVMDNDREVVAVAISLVKSGRVRLSGNFAGDMFDCEE